MRRFRQANHPFIARSVVVAALALVATLPVPAHAAQAGVGEWGLFFFFAVVTGVVIVLLLYEVVGEHAGHEQAPERRLATGKRRVSARSNGTSQ